jgi:hypothetical protein
MGISSAGEKWQKQLPVNDGWMNFISENVFILNKENLYMILPGGKSIGSKIDCNNYTYGSPSPDPASSGYEEYFGHTTALKILPNGTITQQVFNDIGCSKLAKSINEIYGIMKHMTTNNTGQFYKVDIVKFTFPQ